MTVIRVQKDKNNPYFILNRGFLEDPTISLKLKGFLAFCLSKPDHWKFHVRHLVIVLKENKDSIYSVINEGIEHGYIERNLQKMKGKFDSVDYVIHETKIQKIITVSGNPDAVIPVLENPTIVINDKKEIKEKTQKEEGAKPPPPAPPLCFGTHVRLKSREEYDELTKAHGKEVVDQVILEINDYICAKGVKPYKDYAAAIRNWIRRKKPDGMPPRTSLNDLGLIETLKTRKHLIQSGKVILGHNYAEFPQIRDAYFKIGDPGFRDKVLNTLRKMGESVEGL